MIPKEDFLRSLYQKCGGIKLGLGRVADAFPLIFEKKIPVYHVAGTNGKGTTVYGIDAILRSNDFKVGRFISPHLLNYNERIAVNGEDISDEAVLEIYNYLNKKINNFDELSFFEVTFLIAWKFFEISGCDRAVFEVGLGGRLDATNVINYPKTDIITSIGLDHTRILGDTLEKIALEKLGIVKKDDSVFIGRSSDTDFDKWMIKTALEKGAKSAFDDKLDDFDVIDSLCPEQNKNIRLAVKSVTATESLNLVFPDFSQLKLPGRFEMIEPGIVADVAHNPPAVRSLCETVAKRYSKVVVLYGAMKDKDISSVLDFISEISDNIFVINLDADNRGAKISDIEERASSSVKSKIRWGGTDEETMKQAVDFAKENEKILLVTGSFHTIEKFMIFRKNLH